MGSLKSVLPFWHRSTTSTKSSFHAVRHRPPVDAAKFELMFVAELPESAPPFGLLTHGCRPFSGRWSYPG